MSSLRKQHCSIKVFGELVGDLTNVERLKREINNTAYILKASQFNVELLDGQINNMNRKKEHKNRPLSKMDNFYTYW
jgi:hypothetical protein